MKIMAIELRFEPNSLLSIEIINILMGLKFVCLCIIPVL